MERRVFALLSLFLLPVLIGCCSSHSPWHLEKTRTPYNCYNSSRLTFCHSDKINIEFDYSNGLLLDYLNTFSLSFPENAPDQTLIIVTIQNERQEWLVDRLKGGQRLTLTCEQTDFIWSALQTGNEVEIKAGRYTLVVTS